MANYVTSTSDKSKTTALLLCIFLGGIGVIISMLAESAWEFYIFSQAVCSA